jgi:putative addiction module CopG family antidote
MASVGLEMRTFRLEVWSGGLEMVTVHLEMTSDRVPTMPDPLEMVTGRVEAPPVAPPATPSSVPAVTENLTPLAALFGRCSAALYSAPEEHSRMKVFLTPDLQKLVNEKVATGKYGSVDEVVRKALHLLQEHDQQKYSRAEELRSKVGACPHTR